MGQMLTSVLRFCVPIQDRPTRPGTRDYGSLGSFDASGGELESSQYSEALPRIVPDEEETGCFGCAVVFNTMVRRHHCRRCRNIYCRKCSNHTDRLVMYGELKPVRLCSDCAEAAPAENMFVERHIPLLREGATLVRLALMARRIVHVRVTPDLSALEETETSRGTGRTYHHALDDVEAVEMGEGGGGWVGAGRGGHDVGGGVPPVIVIRLKGKGQLKLEACTTVERDLWVSALEAAVHRRRAPSLAAEVEQQRWARREKAELHAQQRRSAQRRRENEASRSRMAEKYGLDPKKYASRPAPRYDDRNFREERGGSGGGSGGFGGVFSGLSGGGGGFGSGGGGDGGVVTSGAGGGFAERLPLMAAVAQH